MVTTVPTGPELGDSEEIFGGVPTVKIGALLTSPFTVTCTLPEVAPVGTGATICVSFQLLGEAAVPLNFRVLVPWVAPKSVPVMVTTVPTGPEAGLIEETDGGLDWAWTSELASKVKPRKTDKRKNGRDERMKPPRYRSADRLGGDGEHRGIGPPVNWQVGAILYRVRTRESTTIYKSAEGLKGEVASDEWPLAENARGKRAASEAHWHTAHHMHAEDRQECLSH
jgi:hypothetical protein